MSLFNKDQHDLIQQAKLLQYANTKRNDGDFNDVTIRAGAESIPANRMVLACYSKFFESMFLLQLKEKNQNTMEIKGFDGQAVKSVIEFIYTGKIDINANNVMTLLCTADYLLIDDVKKLCFNFMENTLTVDNCLDVIKSFDIYNNLSSFQRAYIFFNKNFDKIVQGSNFTDISKLDLTSLITNINRNTVKETSLYAAIINWVKHDETRETEFASLFLKLDLQKLSPDFVSDTIANEQLVKESNACLNAVLSYFTSETKLAQHKHNKMSKILCLGGNMKFVLKSTILYITNKESNIPIYHVKCLVIAR